MNKPAAIYARVSSDRQKENHTIASQTAALIEYAQGNGYTVPAEWVFQDEGYSGANLVRPGLEALRDLAAEGQIRAALVYSPDRLSRKYAYQVLLAEELSGCGVELVFLKAPAGTSPEDQLLVQFQGMIAEYERAQIIERSRRGKRHKAQAGLVNTGRRIRTTLAGGGGDGSGQVPATGRDSDNVSLQAAGKSRDTGYRRAPTNPQIIGKRDTG